MAVNVDQVNISPFTSTVPLVQVPPEQMEAASRPAAPLQGQFGKKGTGSLAIGDALLRGFIQGHQAKEQRKQAQAQATIAAADSAVESAYGKYQDALSSANGNQQDPNAQGSYQAYLDAFQKSKEAKAQFVIPEKPAKGQSSTQKKGEKGEKKSGWGNFKDFFEANPHIVPQIALMTMQPKPPGQSPEGQLQTLKAQGLSKQNELDDINLDEAKRKQTNEKTYQAGYAQFAPLSQEEVAKLPPDVKKQYDQWEGSKAALTPMRQGGTMYTYKLPNGQLQKMYPEEAQQVGAELYVAAKDGKLGSREDFIGRFAKDNQIPTGKLTAGQVGVLDQLYKFYNELPSEYSSTSWHIDDKGQLVPLSVNNYRGPQPPKIPQGMFAPGTQFFGGGQPAAGGMSRPPSAPSASAARTGGGMARPPQVGVGKPAMSTFQKTQATQRVNTQQVEMYQKAEKEYQAAVTKARTMLAGTKIDQAGYQKMVDDAQQALQNSKNEVKKWYDQQVKSIGGTPGDEGQSQSNGQIQPPPQRSAPSETKAYFVSGFSQPVALSDSEAALLKKNGYTVEDLSALAR